MNQTQRTRKNRPGTGKSSGTSAAATARGSAKGSARSPKASGRLRGPKRPDFRKTILPNGVRVVTERHGDNRAVSCGVWVESGTRDEHANESGLAHFIEHLVFKRTKKRNAYEIARAMEAVGGDLNAFTSRESTAFVTHSLREHLNLSLDVLSDLVCRPGFDSGDIKKEKQVVIQEIHMSEDQLEEAIFDKYFELAYRGTPLSQPILGTVKSIEDMQRSKVVDFHRRHYVPSNSIVSVAGNFEHEQVLDLVLKHLKFEKPAKGAEPLKKERKPLELTPFREVIRRPSEQVHILVGLPASDYKDRLRFEGYIVNTLLGGGMTSRLYQSVREDRGLVYAIHSQLTTFTDTGLNLVYAGTEPKHTPEVLELILKELKKLKKQGLKKADVQFFKTQVLGQILLGADDIENRMNSLAANEMVFGRYRSVDDVMKDVEAVNVDTVNEYIDTWIDLDKLGILLMGALPEAPTKKWLESL